MSLHALAGRPVPPESVPFVPRIVAAFYDVRPDMTDPACRVAFGTSGHRGRSERGAFNEDHVVAIVAAILDVRKRHGVDGPLVLAADTHALSEPAFRTALGVLAAAQVDTIVQEGAGFVPTPVASHAILTRNAGKRRDRCDGIVLTPSHNPPDDGGLKYDPPHGGPAGTDVTRAIEDRANEILERGVDGIARVPFQVAWQAPSTHRTDLIGPYVEDLGAVVDVEAVARSGVRIGVDPLGGSSVDLWPRVAERWDLDLTVVQSVVDPSFRFMRLDGDGRIRMDCSSPHAMAGLVEIAADFDVAIGNDPDADRHGIVTRDGLMNPNHFIAASVEYLFRHRPAWRPDVAVGKTLVTSSIVDRIATDLGRPLVEVPVGFKWFVHGLLEGTLGFGGEESAGATFLRRDGTTWTTDKDGVVMGLLAAEMTAVTGFDPSEAYARVADRHGRPVYRRTDAPATAEQKRILAALDASAVTATELAGEPIEAVWTTAPSNGEPIGGLKVVTRDGWFAARPSGTEDVYKIYAESFRDQVHLDTLVEEATLLVDRAFASAGAGSPS